MTRLRIDVRLEFPRISHRPRIDPNIKKANDKARNRRWQIANKAKLALWARLNRAKKRAATCEHCAPPSPQHQAAAYARWGKPTAQTK